MTATPFHGRLLEGETVLWHDRPRQGLMLTSRDLLMVPFSLLWGGFALFWESTVLRTNAPWGMALFGLPFVLAGLFLIAGRFPFDAWLRSRTVYGLTDRRVLIARAAPWGSFRALGLDRLPEATLTEGADGTGTIRFGTQAPLWSGTSNVGYAAWVPSLDPTPQFLAVADARRVFDTLQRLSQEGQGRSQEPSPR